MTRSTSWLILIVRNSIAMFRIYVFLILLLAAGVPSAGVAAYIASVPCRILVSRGRQPKWHIALGVAMLMGILAALFAGGTDIFRPSRWDTGKITIREIVPLWFAAASIGAFVAASYVVRHYRNKLEHSNSKF